MATCAWNCGGRTTNGSSTGSSTMINRADRLPVATLLGFGLGALLLSLIAWRVLTLGMAEHLSRADPDAALRWRAGYAEAQLRQLERQVRDPQHPAAQ